MLPTLELLAVELTARQLRITLRVAAPGEAVLIASESPREEVRWRCGGRLVG